MIAAVGLLLELLEVLLTIVTGDDPPIEDIASSLCSLFILSILLLGEFFGIIFPHSSPASPVRNKVGDVTLKVWD